MSEITVTARARAKSGKEKELEDALRAVTGPTHAETGCRRYAVHRDLQDKSSFLIVERWASIADHQAHMATPHVQELFRKVPGLVAAPPEILTFELLPMGDRSKGTL
ncbi:MAG: antibiotic biosynthesis monooxygenase [Elusimicrobia bacterium]|nr:antibiotic biosynthesis monooxygenase [Elusimicrobiota bacterium]